VKGIVVGFQESWRCVSLNYPWAGSLPAVGIEQMGLSQTGFKLALGVWDRFDLNAELEGKVK